jgi:hypothetical protein
MFRDWGAAAVAVGDEGGQRPTVTRLLVFFAAVSGRFVRGRFDYSPESQRLSHQGPIPEGEYWIQPSELQDNAWFRFKNPRAAWGDHWITIHPFPTTNTHGRGGFFIHGGASPGSAGCIDLSINMNKFIEALKRELGGRPKCHIPLFVRYARRR